MTERHDEALEKLLRVNGRARFGPGFADRVMRRVSHEQAGALAAIMPTEFFRLAVVALVVAAALVTFSIAGSATDSAQTTLEAVLGLQPLTADAVYDAAAIFSADGATTS